MVSGLEGVVVTRTRLSHVDGENGALLICGLHIEDIAGHQDFETTTCNLWSHIIHDMPLQTFRERLAQARCEIIEYLDVIECAEYTRMPTYEALRAMIALLPDGTSIDDALRLIAAPAVFLPAIVRIRHGERIVYPSMQHGHSHDFLHMLRGTPPTKEDIEALDAYLVTVIDHGLNASTFASRVVASTGANLNSCVLAGMGALLGPLHGGAPGPVLDMLDSIEVHGDIASWCRRELDSGARLMGFGHRIYRVRDPRADVLKAVLDKRAAKGHFSERVIFAQRVEQIALELLRQKKPDRSIKTNVEFYTALLLENLQIDRTLFTAVFAMSRIAGWIAHAIEQKQDGRLLRPQSEYIGAKPNSSQV